MWYDSSLDGELMPGFRKNTRPFYQERLSNDDIVLLLQIIKNAPIPQGTTEARLELIVGKLKRMEAVK